MMKRLLIILFVGCAFGAQAEDSIVVTVDTLLADTVQQILITDSLPNVVIWQDSAITQMLYMRAQGTTTSAKEEAGYRVQIYSSNRQQVAKNEAIELEQKLTKLIDYPIYITYVSPFWKVRVGNFQTYEEAMEYKRVLISQFPELTGETYVVRDQVKAK